MNAETQFNYTLKNFPTFWQNLKFNLNKKKNYAPFRDCLRIKSLKLSMDMYVIKIFIITNLTHTCIIPCTENLTLIRPLTLVFLSLWFGFLGAVNDINVQGIPVIPNTLNTYYVRNDLNRIHLLVGVS